MKPIRRGFPWISTTMFDYQKVFGIRTTGEGIGNGMGQWSQVAEKCCSGHGF